MEDERPQKDRKPAEDEQTGQAEEDGPLKERERLDERRPAANARLPLAEVVLGFALPAGQSNSTREGAWALPTRPASMSALK